uniref:Uncharacterized protein n=1 Tax=Anguilla anguilla TaxID=7936 RepID=A0A0E9RJ87_ANGAN
MSVFGPVKLFYCLVNLLLGSASIKFSKIIIKKQLILYHKVF